MKKLVVLAVIMLFTAASVLHAQSCCAKGKASTTSAEHAKAASALAAVSKDIVTTSKDDLTSYFRQITNDKGETSLTEVVYHPESNSFIEKAACTPEQMAKCASTGKVCTPECAATCKAKSSPGSGLKAQAIPVNSNGKVTNQSMKTRAPKNTIHQ